MPNLSAIADGLSDAVDAGLKVGLERVADAVRDYPDPPTGSRYKRTGAYAESIYSALDGIGTGYVGSPISYAIYVRGDPETGYEGHDHWEPLIAIGARLTDEVAKDVQDSIDHLLRES